MAIDYGLKRTGLAVCDAGESVCSPLAVLEGTAGLEERIAKLASEEQAEGIVVGLPLNMDGSEGEMARRARNFGGRLAERLEGVEVEFFDERLSSFAAGEMMREAQLTKKGKKKRLDAVAAAAILRAFLEQKGASQ